MPTIETKVAVTPHEVDPAALKPMAIRSAAGTSAITRRKHQPDTTALTSQQIKDAKLPVDMDGQPVDGLGWVRFKETNIWKNGHDRVSQVMSEKDGEVVLCNGKPLLNDDCVLMRYPKAYDILDQKEIDEEASRLAQGMRTGADGSLESTRKFDPTKDMSEGEKIAWISRMQDYHQNSGMIGPTARMDMATAIMVSGGKSAVDAEEERFRRGSAHRESNSDEWAAMFAPTAPTSPAVRGFHGIGATGLGDPTPKTIQQKREGTPATGRRAAAVAAQPKR